MQVEYGLAGAGTYVKDRPVTVLNPSLAGNCCGCEMAVAYQFRVFCCGFFQPADMFLRNYEYVGGGLGIDIFKRECMCIFMDFLRQEFLR